MPTQTQLPIHLESFSKLQKEGFSYIDKTGLIRELLEHRSTVNLLAFPEGFGKSLALDMLKTFFEFGGSKSEFEGLEIARETALCQQYMGKFPVVFLNLGKAAADDYKTACILLGELIRDEALRMQWLMDSRKLTKFDKLPLERMLLGDFSQQRDLYNSLRVLMELLHKHYDKQVILLIDEYDTPLKRAKKKQYYEQMASLIRTVFGRAFKANNSLLLACLAGRRRKPGTAIFRSMNIRVPVDSRERYRPYFGFTLQEVERLLRDYGLEEYIPEVWKQCGGDRFGDREICCTRSVMEYVKRILQKNTDC